ncbi:hypothetical protein DERP_007456 [Dermatophagoides pteronyssinus]|uniref:Uncharacterized protein n=1 Tax=Dermatophagoides pteronyssinus TaxID=6956 RepID=A0ABQ8J4E6_DERPT|nr:hypothetical protein DERP_007456 [Dermatophagoides pteronyssinus]
MDSSFPKKNIYFFLRKYQYCGGELDSINQSHHKTIDQSIANQSQINQIDQKSRATPVESKIKKSND